MTNYTPEHSSGDLGSVTIDFIVEMAVVAVSFVTLIVLVLLYGWMRKNLPRV